MHFIINPLTNKKYSIFSSNGKKLLKQYVKLIHSGGVWEHNTPYEALGIESTATQKEIKKALR
jgi:DnaJ-class molecular chaperone